VTARPLRRRIGAAAVAGLVGVGAGVIGFGMARGGSTTPVAEGFPPVRVTVAGAVADVQSRFVQVGRDRRHYLLYVPPSVAHADRPAPLVLAFHGLHLSAAWMARSTGLIGAADRAGVVLALPDAERGAWNDGRLGPHGPDDVRFATALVDTLVQGGVADSHRVTVSGYSNGAELALVLAAREPRLFAAVVSVSGAFPAMPGTPQPHRPLPAYFTHGTADPVQPWDGRSRRNRLHPALVSEDATVHAFVSANHAGPAREVPTGTGAVQQFVWRASVGGAPVVLYRLVGAGHGWPTQADSHSVVGPTGLDAAALVMQVARNPQPSPA
jgi:polyhydroxybutyrate depolymerase